MKPNVIIITCHDLGDYLGCYGTPVSTPNIDALAGSGAVLENHFSTGTICSPSRSSIVTGCYPHTNGMMGLVHRGWEMNLAKYKPLPAILAENGYETNLFGFQHEDRDPRRLGYARIHPVASNHCDDVVPVFTEWLEAEGRSGKPFLAALGFSEVHRMGMNPSHFKRDVYEPADPSEVEVRSFLPDIPEIRQDLADFYGAVKLVDKMVGQVTEAVARLGLSDNTLILFTTDHGASFIHSKATLYDGGTKVALMMAWNGKIPSGRRVNALTSHVDILPTVLHYLDIPVPDYVEGGSFAQLLSAEPDQAASSRNYVFAEENYNNHFNPGRMVRSAKFKYIKNGLDVCIFDFLIPEVELSTSDFRKNKAVFDFYSAERHGEELYDLENDPGELVNVAENPAYAEVKEELQAVLQQHLLATDDPFSRFRNELTMPRSGLAEVRSKRNQ